MLIFLLVFDIFGIFEINLRGRNIRIVFSVRRFSWLEVVIVIILENKRLYVVYFNYIFIVIRNYIVKGIERGIM